MTGILRPRHVVGPIRRMRAMIVSNVFLLDGGRGDRLLVDTGHRLERPALLAGLRSMGMAPSELDGVLLTHHHSDHAGNAAWLRASFGLRILAHREDAAVLAGEAPPPRLVPRSSDRLAHAFAAIENHTRTRVPVDRALEDGEAVGSLEVHHAPGHTRGSLLLRHGGTSSLLSGDALLAAVPPLTWRQGMCLPHPDYATSHGEAIRSLERFLAAGHAFANLLAGHGRPILGGAREEAARLIASARGDLRSAT